LEEIIRRIAIYAIPLLVAITFHEVAHGYVADKLGDSTARLHGRLNLNPLKHVDLFGTVLLPLLLILSKSPVLFGYAKPVPVNILNLRDPRRGMVYVSAAGPGTNIILALLSGLTFRLIKFLSPETVITVIREGIYASPKGGWQIVLVPLVIMLVVSTQFNILLALFNLIPIPPLDGGRILTGMLPDDIAESFARIERYGMLILIALLFLNPFGIMTRFLGSGIHILSSLFLGN
jgi:Zn-dependent protease